MKDLKITKGEWKTKKNGADVWEVRNNCDYSIGSKSLSITCSLFLIGENIEKLDTEEAESNAKLIADAGTTANKCGLLPSELLKQRDELLKSLELIASISVDHAVIRCAIKTIQKIKE